MLQPIQKDDVLLEDLRKADGDADTLHIWRLGNSGFLLKHRGKFLSLDLYLSEDGDRKSQHAPIVDPSKLDMVTAAACTQDAPESFDGESLVAIKRATAGDLRVILPYGIREEANERLKEDRPEILYIDEGLSVSIDGFNLAGIAASPGEIRRDGIGRCQTVGYVITVGDFRIFHCSETTWYLGLTQALKRLGTFDVFLLPISKTKVDSDAEVTNLTSDEAASLAKTCGVEIVVPSRYDFYEDEAVPTEEFIGACDRLGQDYEVLRPGERLTLERTSAEESPSEEAAAVETES